MATKFSEFRSALDTQVETANADERVAADELAFFSGAPKEEKAVRVHVGVFGKQYFPADAKLKARVVTPLRNKR